MPSPIHVAAVLSRRLSFQPRIRLIPGWFGDDLGSFPLAEQEDFEVLAGFGETGLDIGEGQGLVDGKAIATRGREADDLAIEIDRLIAAAVIVARLDRQIGELDPLAALLLAEAGSPAD